jgi:hypothetical protein
VLTLKLIILASCILFLASGLIDKAEEINYRLSSPTDTNPYGQPGLLQLFIYEPSTSGCDLELCGKVLATGIYIIGPVLFTSSIFGSLIYISCIFRLKKLRPHVSAVTYKIHQTFLNILSIQFTLFITFLILPILVLYFSYLLELSNGSFISTIALIPTGFHSLSSFSVILYSIKPYRMFLMDRINKLAVKLKLTQERVEILNNKVILFSISIRPGDA